MAFHVRDGDNPAKRRVPGRLIGDPPQDVGPLAGFTIDSETMQREFLAACDWDQESCTPSRAKLESLGLKDVAQALHG
jgi:aldehyde:ferredoxin oxidoreductase